MKTYSLHVAGTHCASCKILIEDLLAELPLLDKAEVNLNQKKLVIETNSILPLDQLVASINNQISNHGYSVSREVSEIRPESSFAWLALPLGFGLLLIFFLLQKSGLLNVGFGSEVTPGVSLLIGLIASVSSCLAVVGGLVLSLSARLAEDNVSDTKTFLLFHLGRLASFGLLGGALGAFGSVIGLSFTFSALLGLLASLVMILLGLQLLGFLQLSQLLPASPQLFNFFRRVEGGGVAAFSLGAGTFFLPCGFTQAMQIVALSSGSFVTGSLIMFAFALGTLPVLALLSFGATPLSHSRFAFLFFPTAGVVVVGLGIFSLLSGLAGLGLINPLFNL